CIFAVRHTRDRIERLDREKKFGELARPLRLPLASRWRAARGRRPDTPWRPGTRVRVAHPLRRTSARRLPTRPRVIAIPGLRVERVTAARVVRRQAWTAPRDRPDRETIAPPATACAGQSAAAAGRSAPSRDWASRVAESTGGFRRGSAGRG